MNYDDLSALYNKRNIRDSISKQKSCDARKKISKVIKFIKVSYLFAHVLCVVERASAQKEEKTKTSSIFPWYTTDTDVCTQKKVRNKLISMTKTNAVQVKSIHANLFIYGVQWQGVYAVFFMNE